MLALAGCGLGNFWPVPPPGVPDTIQVTVFGDSLIADTAGPLHNALIFDGQPNRVVDQTVLGSGLLDPGIHTYINDRLPASGVVVFEYVGMCYSCPAPVGSPTYFALWESSMRQVIDDVRAKGLAVVWVKPPPVANPLATGVATAISALVDRVTSQRSVVEADWWAALADFTGAYQDDLWYDDFLVGGSVHRVRAQDGFHLSDLGRQRVSAWTAAAVIDAAT